MDSAPLVERAARWLRLAIARLALADRSAQWAPSRLAAQSEQRLFRLEQIECAVPHGAEPPE